MKLVSNVTLAIGLALLGSAHSIMMLITAWLMLGIGMGLGLYDAGFGALGRTYGDKARRAITGITLTFDVIGIKAALIEESNCHIEMHEGAIDICVDIGPARIAHGNVNA